ncbi:uncharacterized protein FIBRA_05758 [Fibroporia radiculosa]|uniref:Uncharacterized protein n=1 Tax=Fibroporia radiculosa TaxID=599839 RepID=J4IAW4_9APHY|nr:uncharacterized protein FIBRA_05758 [Fibroporia radiculosa]CCM03616.1 predicted protein [Fibroporia radiculosa]
MSKRRVEALCADSDDQRPVPRPKPKPKLKSSDRPDPRMKHLEYLHEKTAVKENLKISDGQQIRLDGKPKLQTRMNDQKGMLSMSKSGALRAEETTTIDCDINLVNDSDDDLPDAEALLATYDNTKKLKTPHSDTPETSYSNSEIDALIRDAPLDLGDFVGLESPRRGQMYNGTNRNNSSRTPSRQKRISPLKRKREGKDEGGSVSSFQPLKAARLGGLPNQTPSSAQQKEPKPEPLFILDSSDDEEVSRNHSKSRQESANLNATYQDNNYDDFFLDPRLFDIIPDQLPGSPNLVPTLTCSRESDTSTFQSARTSSPGDKYASKDNHVPLPWQDDEADADLKEYERDVAELEAWLHSDPFVLKK